LKVHIFFTSANGAVAFFSFYRVSIMILFSVFADLSSPLFSSSRPLSLSCASARRAFAGLANFARQSPLRNPHGERLPLRPRREELDLNPRREDSRIEIARRAATPATTNTRGLICVTFPEFHLFAFTLCDLLGLRVNSSHYLSLFSALREYFFLYFILRTHARPCLPFLLSGPIVI
jgi:hypothetical protein